MASRCTRSFRPLAAVAAIAVLPVLGADAIAQEPNTWSATGSMGITRSNHTATRLLDGTVLVAAGDGGSPLALRDTSEVYDPVSGSWSDTGNLPQGRSGHTATRLADGRVLVAGGAGQTAYLSTADVYDPATRTWSVTGSMSVARFGHTATLLPDGRVLVAGGDSTAAPLGPPEVFLSSAEVYDPATGTWSTTGSLAEGRINHTATLLPDGQVLAAGGFGTYQTAAGYISIRSAELYDPSNGTWSATGNMVRERAWYTATLLEDGRVLAVGGAKNSAQGSAEVYSPSTGTWSLTGALTALRWQHSAERLEDGRVIVAGGYMTVPPPSQWISTASAEVYDPSAGTWSSIDNMASPRTFHTMTALSDGRILLAGGRNDRRFLGGITFLSSAEVYNAEIVPPPSLSIDDVTIAEGHSGTTIALFTVTLSAASTDTVTVNFATSDETATAGTDYAASAGTLTFNPGDTARTIEISVNGDADFEPNERFFVTLDNAVNATIADIEGTATIANDDLPPPPSLSIDDVTIAEGDPGRMALARSSHTSTRLLDGRVLVAGRGSAEVFDPALGIWSGAGAMSASRWVFTATTLLDGRVLAAGGWDYTSPFSSSELYDPVANTWSNTGSLGQARWDHSATLLADGRVLVAGGSMTQGSGSSAVTVHLASAEVYDPATGTWAPTGSMAVAHSNHVAARLLDGRVLVMGGRKGVASAEVYDPATGVWSPAGSMATARCGHAAVRLPNGNVLVAGGGNGIAFASAEVYSPVTNTWSATGSMSAARYWFSPAWVLPNGRVLVAGSFGDDGHASAELFDPLTGTWSATGSMAEGRGVHRATLLLDGRVLVTGGSNSTSGRLASAEVYSPLTGLWSPAGARTAVFTVSLSSASAQTVTVDFATSDGTAVAGSDYAARAGILTFDPGETARTIEVSLNADVDVEGDETFLVSLGNATNAVIAVGEGTGTVTNDDLPLSTLSTDTPAGSNVSASLPPLSLTFASVTQAGPTQVTMSNAGPPLPSGFQLGDPPTYIDLSTTAVFEGPVHVCVHYSAIAFPDESLLRLFHFDDPAWMDITTSVDTVGNVICGAATSLSPFAVLMPSGTLAPVLTLPAGITAEATSAAGATVAFTATARHESDGPLPVVCNPSSGTTYPLGVTAVNCSATDSVGNATAGSFAVTVVDTTAPALTLPSDVTASTTSPVGVEVSFVTSATDLVDGTVDVTCSPASGSTFPIGTTTVSCTATDSHGLTAAGSFTVSVTLATSNAAPRVRWLARRRVRATSPSGAIVRFRVWGVDREDGLLSAVCSPRSGDLFPIGRTVVTCTTTDSAGAVGTGSFAVNVKPPRVP